MRVQYLPGDNAIFSQYRGMQNLLHGIFSVVFIDSFSALFIYEKNS